MSICVKVQEMHFDPYFFQSSTKLKILKFGLVWLFYFLTLAQVSSEKNMGVRKINKISCEVKK